MDKLNLIIILGVLLIGVFSFLFYQSNINYESPCRIIIDGQEGFGIINGDIQEQINEGDSFDLKIKTTCGWR